MDAGGTKAATVYIMALFALQPMAFGSWLALIPYIKDTLMLSKSELALALLGMPLALIPTLQLASRIVAKIGPRKTFALLLPIQTMAVLSLFLAIGLTSLFVVLALFGAVIAFLEVALNTYAGRLEKAAGILIMSRCHGFWALGVGAGSFFATLLFYLGPVMAVFIICVVSVGLGVWVGLKLPKLTGEAEAAAAKARKLRQMPRALLSISAFVLVISIVEGAMSDWAPVNLAERLGGRISDAGIAVTFFAGFLALGRFIGDYMRGKLGARGVARLTVMVAITGVVSLTFFSSIMSTFIGFALIGLGVSIGFPLGVSQVAALDDTHEGQNIATMAMIAMSGFLVGPPLIGFIAEAVSLRVGLMALLPSLMVALYLTKTFPTRDSSI